MRAPSLLLVSILSVFVTACSSPRQDYVSQHPDLPSEHRRIMLAGKISYSDPVVGMTKDEIRLTMGTDPAKIEFSDGEELWIWTKDKISGQTVMRDATSAESVDAVNQAKHRSASGGMSAPEKRIVKTTVFFHGDRANRAQIDED